jgi:hypothetical protein
VNRQTNQKSGAVRRPDAQGLTEKQGEYLAFIYTCSYMFRCAPAEADIRRHFQVSSPSVYQMVVTLERAGLPNPLGSKSISQILCDEVLGQKRLLQSIAPKRLVRRVVADRRAV